MRPGILAVLPLIVTIVSCGGGSASDAGDANTPLAEIGTSSRALPGNTEIVQKAYDPNYFVPDGFFVDPLAATETRSYTVHHVLDDSRNYELCSDDLTQAQNWEAADNASRAVNGYLVTVIEHERYFEFVRELSYQQDVGNIESITSPGYARVFKCSHTDRTGVDRNQLDGYSGVRHAQPLNAAALRDFTEYLWQFRFFTAKRRVVLDSYAGLDAGNTAHSLLLALVYSQGNQRCDRVDLVEWQFTAQQSNGQISRRFNTIRSFEAEIIGGVPQICS